ncbi:Cilia/flagella-associated protein 20/WDR90/C3orf67 [Halteromyces radiatus]|uniref:Cilia/flagella-associated protein 20/WDR90/C3orf67 n=1 Tax=Halteromyces radiatus TaxID=101107 RepID=UPI00221E77F3|nr:Cilia/flagella-associated protein 20/WDR90/C3orf67 [Halteromyces radiatus]KAI8089537.1 Cilia/flagella-associated protein 20/WDR90/C3orf67 [Halteromyces radiatus]
MFRNTFQSGFLSILYSLGNEPLQLWTIHTDESSQDKDDSNDNNQQVSKVERVQDTMISSNVIELVCNNHAIANTYITCPPLGKGRHRTTLGIKLPYLVFIVKNLDQYVSFEVQVVDDKQQTRRFRCSNYQLETRVKPIITTMPLRLEPGWNQMVMDLPDLVKRAYATTYLETARVTVHANCRLRRIYFADRLCSEDELPPEFKLFLPVDKNS